MLLPSVAVDAAPTARATAAVVRELRGDRVRPAAQAWQAWRKAADAGD